MSGQAVNLRQRFHHETGVIVVYKVAYSIHCVRPRAVGVLILQDKIQVSFRDFPVIFVAKNLGGAGEQKGTISGGIDNPTLIERRVGTTARSVPMF